jgi:hypothetical protein
MPSRHYCPHSHTPRSPVRVYLPFAIDAGRVRPAALDLNDGTLAALLELYEGRRDHLWRAAGGGRR